MDNYVEQIVAKKSEARDTAIRLIIFLGLSLVAALALICTVLFGFAFLLVVAVGAIYLMWYLLGNTSVEYEYIVTNNELDVDKITGRRKRKRLITLKLNLADEWGEYDENKNKNEKVQATVSAHDCRYINLWYLVANHEKHGKTMLLFSPNEDVLTAVNKSVPYNLKNREITKAAEKRMQEEAEKATLKEIEIESSEEVKIITTDEVEIIAADETETIDEIQAEIIQETENNND